MRIVTVRRIAQGFFLGWFMWFCVVATYGTKWWELRGWPVNLILQLDPLVAIGTLLSTHTIYRGLAWALVTVIMTILFGRVFCGWVCPFGTMHQFLGYVGNRSKRVKDRIASNRYRRGQNIKYFFLIAFLIIAAFPIGTTTSLLTGLLDPIALVHRSVNIVVVPIADSFTNILSITPRHYDGAWMIGLFFLAALLMNFAIPRFYCRFVCPAGALFGILSRFALWRIGKTKGECSNCQLCEKACEGACHPAGKIRISECVLCFNCLGDCKDDLVKYRTNESESGEITNPDFGRRGFVLSAACGLLALPIIRLEGKTGANWHYKAIRPPGSLNEEEFLQRCIRCGQCMRVCPTNIIMPSGLDGGMEGLWTPTLNFRIGTSGCQLNCTACGGICPTAAIRPISLSEKLGIDEFAKKGPIRIGMAFVDKPRCLPWSMKTPCIVCEENCPVTPKAIYVEEFFEIVRDGVRGVVKADGTSIELDGLAMKPGKYATGDYFLAFEQHLEVKKQYRITGNDEHRVTIDTKGFSAETLNRGEIANIFVRLQAPVVDIEKCIGCGICEHECPVSGKRAIRVSGENESRSTDRSLVLKRR